LFAAPLFSHSYFTQEKLTLSSRQKAVGILGALWALQEQTVWKLKQEAGQLSPYFETFMEPRNRFQGMNSASLCSLAGQYDNPIPTRFLALIDCLKIPAQNSWSSLGMD
jgi:hypothetical protein